MVSPFPGMNPYLENPELWSEVHHRLITAIAIGQKIPKFLLPLQLGDREPLVDLQSLLLEVYEQAGFDLTIDYNLEPLPSLPQPDKVWADVLLKEIGLRQQH